MLWSNASLSLKYYGIFEVNISLTKRAQSNDVSVSKHLELLYCPEDLVGRKLLPAQWGLSSNEDSKRSVSFQSKPWWLLSCLTYSWGITPLGPSLGDQFHEFLPKLTSLMLLLNSDSYSNWSTLQNEHTMSAWTISCGDVSHSTQVFQSHRKKLKLEKPRSL